MIPQTKKKLVTFNAKWQMQISQSITYLDLPNKTNNGKS